jgi:outer membrane receptor protein involved in Fe transport
MAPRTMTTSQFPSGSSPQRKSGRQLRCGLFCVLAFCSHLVIVSVVGAQQSAELRGTVIDSTNSSIQGVRIELRTADGTRLAVTDEEGHFAIPDVSGGTLLVRYPGFAPVSIEITPELLGSGVHVQLTPAPDVRRIVVSAQSDDRVPAVPASEFSIPAEQIQASGAATVDEVLRQAPGFSLFRRSGSLFANPTTQGVSLRGIGASGASRSNVLLDGIPLNDPFGRWVHWNAVPRVSIADVQVFNGAASDTYGGGALGGVVNLHSRPVSKSFGALEASYGALDTPDLSFDGGLRLGDWGISANGEALRTEGYILVPASQRGTVDTPAGTADLAGTMQLSRTLAEQGMFFVRATSFAESRKNGTPLQTNNTRLPGVAAGSDWTISNIGSFSVRVYGADEVYNQNSSSVAANRNSETLTDVQRSPSQDLGLAGQWQRTFGGRHTVTAGIEALDAQGHSMDTTSTARTDAGGRQRTLGYFGQDAVQLAPTWLLTFGGRIDTWLNSRGYLHRTAIPGGAFIATTFANRSETAFDPRVSLLHTFPHNVSASVSVYRAFRAPTLNELYRSFRVGNVVTNANPNLNAERLTGGEASASLREWHEKLTLRATFFWSEIRDLITNTLVSAVPAGCNIGAQPGQTGACATITDLRANIGSTRARGVELSAELRLRQRMQISAGYVFNDSTSVSGTPFVRAQVPLVPKNEVTAQWSYAAPRWTAGVQGRFVGNALDDTTFLPLGRAFTVDAEVSRQILPHANLFLAAQNLFDDRYNVARTPVSSLGPPVLLRGGIRLDFGGR